MDTDRQAIVDLAVAYCWALDTRDWGALDRVFTADATAILGSPLLTGVDAITRRVTQALSPLESSQHMVNTHQVSVDGDAATSRCYFHAQHVRRVAGGDGASPNFVVAGRYEDRLVRTSDGWRITHRELVTMWTEGNERVVRGDG